MSRFKILFIILIVGANFSSCKQSEPEEKVLQLIWSDEFEGTELDLNKWEIQTGNGSQYGLYNWGNNEEQYYQEDNISVSNGKLLIKAVGQSIGDYDYSSGRIRSLGGGDFKYGRIEASIRMASTEGLWHAFWMLPSEPSESWPVSGEIDVMEFIGNQPNEIFNTIHFANSQGNHTYLGDLEPLFLTGAFNNYAVEWDENSITWFIDDIETYKVLRSNSAISETWPFDAKFHILLNTAVGGNLGGNVDSQSLQIPKFLEVEYVRVYQSI